MQRLEHLWSLPQAQDKPALHFGLSLPATPAPEKGWPLLCLLDGDWTWPIALASDHPALSQCAVLYPYYGGTPAHIRLCRAWDYTPSNTQGKAWPDPRMPEWQCGGADTFLAVLRAELTTLTHTYPQLDRRRISLFGHSYAGLFVLYALMRGLAPVQHFICASPSLWWRAPYIWHQLDSWSGKSDSAFTLIAGRDEKWYPHAQQGSAPRQGGIATLALMQRLQSTVQPKVEHSRFITLEQAGHGQVLAQATLAALALAQESRSDA